jgi:hypothetical protein
MNKYQSLPSPLVECKAFMAANPTGTVAMSLKIDDWNNCQHSETEVYQALADLINKYPTLKVSRAVTLGEARGTIHLIYREENYWSKNISV